MRELARAVAKTLQIIEPGLRYSRLPKRERYGNQEAFDEAFRLIATCYAEAIDDPEFPPQLVHETGMAYIKGKITVTTRDGGSVCASEFPTAVEFASACKQTRFAMYKQIGLETPDGSLIPVWIRRGLAEDVERIQIDGLYQRFGLTRPALTSEAESGNPVRLVRSDDDQAETLLAQLAEAKRLRQTA